jgi:hypothetical protein
LETKVIEVLQEVGAGLVPARILQSKMIANRQQNWMIAKTPSPAAIRAGTSPAPTQSSF